MPSDLKIDIKDEPGALAQVGEALGKAGINIDGVCGIAEDRRHIHVLVDDVERARTALAQAGIECDEDREVEVLSIVDQPGEMGRHLRKVGDAGINLDMVYLATNTRLVLGSPDLEGLRRALHG